MEITKKPRSCGTHDGTFHADEVTACALLIVFGLVDRNLIVRTREQKLLETCEYVCDVGGFYEPEKKLFDHHQADYRGQLSSAGMVLIYLKEKGLISPHQYDFFNNSLVKGVDDHDNGRDPQIQGLCTYSDVLANFTPIHYDVDAGEFDKAFFEALDFVVWFIVKKRERYNYVCSCRTEVEKAMDGSLESLIFDKTIPWMDAFFDLGGVSHPALFVVMPAGRHWKLRGIPPSPEERMDVRLPLPEDWAGLLEGDLKQKTGIEGAIFCHKGRFISIWETKEDALKALEMVLSKSKECL